MVSELHLRYEHEIMTREKFERKFTDSAVVIQQRDVKITDLKSKLEKAEREAAKVVELRRRVSELEAVLAAKSREVAGLNGRNFKLLGKVSSLKSTREELDSQVSKLKVDCEVLRNEPGGGKVISLAINKGIQEVLEAGIEHGKSRRSLAQVEAYDLEVKNEYVVAVTAFENVSFALLDELGSLKDSALVLVMSALVTIPVYSESGSIIHEMRLSKVIPAVRVSVERRGLCSPSSSASGGGVIPTPLQDSSFGVANYQVSTLTLITGEVPATLPAVSQPHDDLFDATILDKLMDA
ncbi:hypothetical protein Tco_1212874 [Tanacetum coccineum]